MTQIASTPPGTIRARIHDSAIRRVTRIYASTLSDVMSEALQNSRRADATRVRIAVGPLADQLSGEPGFTVTIADDGSGIVDPAVLLSFGENGWSDDLVRREDAAGFGFASLSRRGCTVSSRPRSPDDSTIPGWRVDLAPEHFLGEAEAEVHPNDGAPFPHGDVDIVRGPPSPPPRSAMRPRMPPGITLCRSFMRRFRPRNRAESSSTAGPFSTARSMPSPGAASPSASSAIAIAATTTPTSISTA